MSDTKMKPTIVVDFPRRSSESSAQDQQTSENRVPEYSSKQVTTEARKSLKASTPKISLDMVHRRYPTFPKVSDDSLDNKSVGSDATPNSDRSDASNSSTSQPKSPKSPRTSNRYLKRPYARSRNRWTAQQQQQSSEKASGPVILAEPHSFRQSSKDGQQPPHETRKYNQSITISDLQSPSSNRLQESKNNVIHELQMIIDDEEHRKKTTPSHGVQKVTKIQDDDESTLSCSDDEVDIQHTSSALRSGGAHSFDLYFAILAQPLDVPNTSWCGEYMEDMCNSAVDTMIRWEHNLFNPQDRRLGRAIEAA